MIIESHNITASAQRSFVSSQTTSLSVTEGIQTGPGLTSGVTGVPDFSGLLERFRDSIESGNQMLSTQSTWRTHGATGVNEVDDDLPLTPQELRQTMLSRLLEMLLQTRVRLRERIINGNGMNNNMGQQGINQQAIAVRQWTLSETRYESETVTYQAKGLVNTKCGQSFNIDINMHMSREFVSLTNVSVLTQTLVDPLVINYGGNAASLTGEMFEFDLTMTGTPDWISSLGAGSGFLAYNKYGDGTIKDGSQLFGPQTGCGFSELRKHDVDGNGWIDAGDSIFAKLVVWSRDQFGNCQIFTLAELGIGAIYLGDVATEFSFKDNDNQTLGVMRSTSFFLRYCGGVGTLSHIDLALGNNSNNGNNNVSESDKVIGDNKVNESEDTTVSDKANESEDTTDNKSDSYAGSNANSNEESLAA